MRDKGEGCPCKALGGPQNAKQSVTEMLTKLYNKSNEMHINVYYKCPPQAIFLRNYCYFEFFPGF